MTSVDRGKSAAEGSFWVENELDVPLISPALLNQLEQFDSTHLGTMREPDPESDYMFRPSLQFLSGQVPDHYVLSFWGHGANSYSANFRFAYGDVAVLFQISFGAYTDFESSRTAWNTAVAATDTFLSDVITKASGETRERDTIVAYSDFRQTNDVGSGITVYSRGRENTWAPHFTCRSWEEFLKKYPSN